MVDIFEQRSKLRGTETRVPQGKDIFEQRASLRKPDRGSLEKTARLGAQYGLGATDLALLPLTMQADVLGSQSAQESEFRKGIFEDIERLAEQKSTGVWDDQDERLYQELQEQIRNPEKARKHVKTADVRPSSLIRKGIKGATEYDLQPESTGEHVAEFLGGFNPKDLVNLGKSAVKNIPKLITKEGRQELKQASQWKALEKSAKNDPHKQEILDFSRQKNLTPQESTLLLQSDAKINTLERIAKKSKKFKGAVSGLKEKLGNSYEELKRVGRQGGYVTEKEVSAIQKDLGDVLTDISKTYVEGPDTLAAKGLIEKTIENLNNKVGTVEDLINSRRNLRQFGNWNKLNEGSAIRAQAEKAFTDAIERKNPKVAEMLKQTDKAWAKYKKFEEIMDKNPHVHRWHGIPLSGIFGHLAFASLGLLSGGVVGVAKAYLAKELIQRLSTRLLTDPKFQSIHKRIIQSIVSGSVKNQRGIFHEFLKILKEEDPDLYKEMNDSVVKNHKE